MALIPVNVGNNPQQPGSYAQAYLPDQLIGGDAKLITQPIIFSGGIAVRGTVVGQTNSFPTTVTPGANTGNGTVTNITASSGLENGSYTLRATSPTVFTVTDPAGATLGNATVGTAYTSNELNFTINAGSTAFVAGDSFVILVSDAIGTFVVSKANATDGSQNPVGILVDYTDASAGAVRSAIYAAGEFNAHALVFDPNWTVQSLTTAMRPYQLIIKQIAPGFTAVDPL